jgi:glycosyltransferase involved in cell wall biosynthesis
MTKQSVDSLIENTTNLKEVIIIDDCSKEDYNDFFYNWLNNKTKDKDINIKYHKFENPSGVTMAWNFGVQLVTHEYIAVVNNDVLFSPEWDEPLIEGLSEDVLLASPYHTRHDVPDDWPKGSGRHSNDFNMLGCAFMTTKSGWEKIGKIDERIKIWYNDNWLVKRITVDLKKEMKEIKESYVHHLYSKTCNERAKPGFTRQVGDDGKMFEIICQERGW